MERRRVSKVSKGGESVMSFYNFSDTTDYNNFYGEDNNDNDDWYNEDYYEDLRRT